MKATRVWILVGVFALCAGTANAASLLSKEPPPGKLPAGQTVLVDNGQCHRGQVLSVTGGANRSMHSGGRNTGSKRIYKCVARP